MTAPLPDRLPPKVRALIEQARQQGYAAGRQAERDDVVAHQQRQAGNARRLFAADPTYDDLARDRARQAEANADYIRAGLHEGMAAMMADLGPVLDGAQARDERSSG